MPNATPYKQATLDEHWDAIVIGSGPNGLSAGINYDRIFSPSLISEFRVGVAHYHNDALNSDFGTTASKDIGIPGVNIDEWTSGLASINVNGVRNS